MENASVLHGAGVMTEAGGGALKPAFQKKAGCVLLGGGVLAGLWQLGHTSPVARERCFEARLEAGSILLGIRTGLCWHEGGGATPLMEGPQELEDNLFYILKHS